MPRFFTAWARVVLTTFTTVFLAITMPANPPEPVTPDASAEARALLRLFHDISGKYLLTGQHNYPNVRSRNTEFALQFTGRTPAVWGSDWGFAEAGDSDSYLARPDIVQEAIRQHRAGAIIHLCWHAVPPTADEPITFQPQPGADPANLASVQGRLSDQQFADVLTPGTALHTKWCAQVDAVAVFLKQLEAARVPILWRPYHEMNGTWFWWGGRPGPRGSAALYRQMFDRYVHHHQLKNLVWVWNVDRATTPESAHAAYFPGIDYADMLSLDVYGNDFAQPYYDSLVQLAQGKPLALAEVGNPPSLEILDHQPLWTFSMTWAGMVRNVSRRQYGTLLSDARVIGLEDPAYAEVTAAYRHTLGLPRINATLPPADFSGIWVLDQDRSSLGRMGASSAPAQLEVAQADGQLTVRSVFILEYTDDRIVHETIPLDGTEVASEMMQTKARTTARASEDGRQLILNSTAPFPWGPPGTKSSSMDTWTLIDAGDALSIHRAMKSPRGEQEVTLIFNRR